jgi:tetratricopeptide (TPR) repeat protein
MDADTQQYLRDVENDSNATYAMRKIAEYYFKEKDYENMKKYYLMALDSGSSIAMMCLAEYYKDTEKNYKLMKKYYKMAIEKGHSNAMHSLGYHYHNTEKNYELMEKYYLMAINKGNADAMFNLGLYYDKIKDYENMKKYYLMAIDKGNSNAMFYLGGYYYEIKDYENMKKYYTMAINKGDSVVLNNLTDYLIPILDKYKLSKNSSNSIEQSKHHNIEPTILKKDVITVRENPQTAYKMNVIVLEKCLYNTKLLTFDLDLPDEEFTDEMFMENGKTIKLLLDSDFKQTIFGDINNNMYNKIKSMLPNGIRFGHQKIVQGVETEAIRFLRIEIKKPSKQYNKQNDKLKKDVIQKDIPNVVNNIQKINMIPDKEGEQPASGHSQPQLECLQVEEMPNKKNTICDRCYDIYIEPSITISCQHKNICHYCTIKLKACHNCGAKYC